MDQDRIINDATQEEGVPATDDIDDIIQREEDERMPPAMPPDSEDDFEKAIQGEDGLPGNHIPPANAD